MGNCHRSSRTGRKVSIGGFNITGGALGSPRRAPEAEAQDGLGRAWEASPGRPVSRCWPSQRVGRRSYRQLGATEMGKPPTVQANRAVKGALEEPVASAVRQVGR